MVDDSSGIAGRDERLYGAYLAAVSFAGPGMHHKICHVLDGAHDLPYAQTHALVLPHVLAYNADAVPNATRRLAAALTDGDADISAVNALTGLCRRLDAPTALRDYGLAESEIPDAVRRILPKIPRSNPEPVTEHSLADLLYAAWAGEPPR